MQKSEIAMSERNTKRANYSTVAVCGLYRFVEHKTKKDRYAVPGGRAMTAAEVADWSVAHGHGLPRFEQVVR